MNSLLLTRAQHLTLSGALALATLSLPAWAGVYKWVDADGVVHYSDQRPEGVSSQEMGIKPIPRSGSEGASVGLDEQVRTLDEKQELERLRDQQASENAEAAKREADNCKMAKENLDVLMKQARIRAKGDDGELHFLTPEEILEQRKKAQEVIDRDCK
ncbi:MAG: DUF4124 domain-containing protein [Hahellaceae bacterium]|nr:DUF4124 domain-containing protein [Hahellaceae bacterium]